MKNILLITGMVLAIILNGCQKDPYPYITIDEAQNTPVQNVAFIYNNDVYFAADIDKPATKITNTGTFKKFIKVSHDHTKFAYLNSLGYVEVVDNTGKLIITLNYTAIKSFDWTADDKTLYILSNGNMYYYGTALPLSITYPGVAGYTTEVLSASVSIKGDFAYVIHAYAYGYGDKYRLVIKPAGSSNVITYDNNIDYSMNYVAFSSNLQDMVVGYRGPNDASYNYTKLEFFTGLNAYPSFSYQSSQAYGTPIYNSTLSFMVSGFTDVNTNKVVLAAISTKDVSKNKISKTYISTGNGVYTDWK